VTANIVATPHLFSISGTSAMVGWSRLRFLGGALAGQVCGAIDVATFPPFGGAAGYQVVLFMPGFSAAPATGDTFVVLPASTQSLQEALTCFVSVDAAVDETHYTIRLVVAQSAIPLGDWLLGCQLVPAGAGAYPPSVAFAGPARRITAVTGTGNPRTVTIDQAFTSGTPEYCYLFSGLKAATQSISGGSVDPPGDPALVKLYLVQRNAEGEFADGRPFRLRLNTPCLDADGELVPDQVTSTDDLVNGYTYAEVYPTASLTRVDGGLASTIRYIVTTAQGLAATEIAVPASPSVQDLSGILHP